MTNLDFPDWSEARSFAEEISQFGAPLLRLTANLGFSSAGLAIPASTVRNLFALTNIDQPGYEAVVGMYLPQGFATEPFGRLDITWVDSKSAIQVAADAFIIGQGDGPNSALYNYISGPCKADQLLMSMTNMDGTYNSTLIYTANVNSHIYTWDRILQPAYSAFPPHGFTNSGGTPDIGVLASRNPTIAASGSDQTLLATYNGKVIVSVANFGNPDDCGVAFTDPQDIYGGGAGAVLFTMTAAAGANVTQTAVLPNGPVLMAITNNGSTGPITPWVTVIKEDY